MYSDKWLRERSYYLYQTAVAPCDKGQEKEMSISKNLYQRDQNHPEMRECFGKRFVISTEARQKRVLIHFSSGNTAIGK
jgi:hypothetical protein